MIVGGAGEGVLEGEEVGEEISEREGESVGHAGQSGQVKVGRGLRVGVELVLELNI